MSGRGARTWALASEGLGGRVVEVETFITTGLPSFHVIGLPDASIGESRERVRAAYHSSCHPLPAARIVTSLSPAAVPKHGSGFDLAIAATVLGAERIIDPVALEGVLHLGELALTGAVRPVTGVLPAVLTAQRSGVATVVVPEANADEARLVEGIRVIGVRSLRDLAVAHGAEVEGFAPEPPDAEVRGAAGALEASGGPSGDLADVLGNDEAVRGLCIAAAGGHHMFMVGPAGCGKTMLAERLPSLLPALDIASAIEVAAIRSAAGVMVGHELDRRPPFQSPHHSATQVALIGGGSGRIRPGAVSLAAHGVLFLDEAPEFPRRVLDALRQPIESGRVVVHRARTTAEYPANAQLVLAANPCPCGNAGVPGADCLCRPGLRAEYLRRLSGPLLDRIDLSLRLVRPGLDVVRRAASGERGAMNTAHARAAVGAARERATARLAGTPWTRNSEVSGDWLRDPAHRPSAAALAPLEKALVTGAISLRGFTRVLRVAWTLADLAGHDSPNPADVSEAVYFRRGG